MINSIKFGIRRKYFTSTPTQPIRSSWKEIKTLIETIEANSKAILNDLNTVVNPDDLLVYDIETYNQEGHYFFLEFDGTTWRMVLEDSKATRVWDNRMRKWSSKRERAYKIMESYLDHNIIEHK